MTSFENFHLNNATGKHNASSRRIKVLAVIGQLDVGGTEWHLARVMPAVQSDSIEIAVYPLNKGGAITTILERHGVKVLSKGAAHGGFLGLMLSLPYLMRTLRRERPDIVHFFLPAAYLIGYLASLALPGAIHVMSRRGLPTYHSRFAGLGLVESFLHRRMQALIGNSRAVVATLASEGAPLPRLGLIPNGVEILSLPDKHGRTQLRGKLGYAETDLLLVIVANLIPYKGHDDLLRALAEIQYALPPKWALACLGRDDGIQENLERLMIELGLNGHVRFHGLVEGVHEYLCAADIGVLASHEEGFSNAILEGMAAGLAMIVTAVGGNTEAVESGQTGLVVPPRQPSQLATAILVLAHDRPLRERLGSAARAHAIGSFSLPACVERYRSLYRSLIETQTLPLSVSTTRIFAEPTSDFSVIQPLVSVVIPVFNAKGTIKRAIESVLHQDYSALECIVVDDGSNDDTVGAIAELDDSRLRIIRLNQNTGAAAARNFGVASSMGEFVAFLDADDEWLPGKLRVQIAFMQRQQPAIPASTTGFEIIRGDRSTGIARIPEPQRNWESAFLDVCDVSPGSTLIIRREVFQALGGFESSLRRFEDWDFLARYTRKYEFSVLPVVLAIVYNSSAVGTQIVNDCAMRLLNLQGASIRSRLGLRAFHRFDASLELERAVAAFRDYKLGAALLALSRGLAKSPSRCWTLLLRFIAKLGAGDF